ncbi:hypothetical protein DSL72_005437 [Monilinia vaccinii-corymbosi]|uniref:Extracellular mutant protein 11 C-terminal domain-containing protein n=1 Tax=Monilinia vaccinii-corymbosi TaxID=61207 RepID=A0A8A3PFP3_9HELO|nr:hypothetical protein DSL72_005437 [Monilinia vaccinii-corymbosi]
MPLNFTVNNFLTNIYDMAAHNKLLGFVDRTTDPPPSPSPQGDRASRQAIASKLRVTRKPRSESANRNRAHNPEPVYGQSVGVPQGDAAHGGYPKNMEYEQEQDQDRDKFETSTVGEDFDDTISQQTFPTRQNMAGAGVSDEYDNDHHRGRQDESEHRYHQAAQYHNGIDKDLQGGSDVGKDSIEDEPMPYQSHKTFHQYDGQGPHTQALGQTIHKQSQIKKPEIQSQPSQNIAAQPNPTKNKIAGRFNQSGQVNTLANRPKSVVPGSETTRKRVFDEEVFSPVPKNAKPPQVVKSLEDSIPRGIPPYVLPPPRNQTMSPTQLEGTSDGEEYSEDESRMEEQPALQSRPIGRYPASNLHHQNGNLKRASIELDYDDAVLTQMDYVQLRDESFEAAPAVPEQSSEPDLSISERTLLERVSYHVEQVRTSNQDITDKERTAMAEFFGNLSKDEWEEAGDWFLDRFGETLIALKKARKEKRDVVAEFEREIERREREVRGCLKAYTEDMERMKRGAKGVIEGKI